MLCARALRGASRQRRDSTIGSFTMATVETKVNFAQHPESFESGVAQSQDIRDLTVAYRLGTQPQVWITLLSLASGPAGG